MFELSGGGSLIRRVLQNQIVTGIFCYVIFNRDQPIRSLLTSEYDHELKACSKHEGSFRSADGRPYLLPNSALEGLEDIAAKNHTPGNLVRFIQLRPQFSEAEYFCGIAIIRGSKNERQIKKY